MPSLFLRTLQTQIFLLERKSRIFPSKINYENHEISSPALKNQVLAEDLAGTVPRKGNWWKWFLHSGCSLSWMKQSLQPVEFCAFQDCSDCCQSMSPTAPCRLPWMRLELLQLLVVAECSSPSIHIGKQDETFSSLLMKYPHVCWSSGLNPSVVGLDPSPYS